jgi:hypothetical protein
MKTSTVTLPLQTQRTQTVSLPLRRALDLGKTYARIKYVPTLPVDLLQLQAVVGEYTPEQGRIAGEFERLTAQIRCLAAGQPVAAEVKTGSLAKREAFAVEQIRAAKAAERKLAAREKSTRKKIAALQKQQQDLIRQRRELNGRVAVERRQAAAGKRAAEAEALAAGRFWECEEATLKEFFRVPFGCRKLVDVSQQHRAALFVELEHGERDGYGALVPTHRAFLCGIDDNGEQWGFRVQAARDEWDLWDYESKVEDAMAVCWGVEVATVRRAWRQGEVLFWAAELPASLGDKRVGTQTLAPSHTAAAPNLWATGTKRDGTGYLWSEAEPIRIEHPTHAALLLPAGSYRYAIHGYDAD